ncbi:MAG: hypothetical protein HC945_02730 [Nitrosarchaeum sp.]|nr:hypothetical protein [Nitrosarchaeum sp.]
MKHDQESGTARQAMLIAALALCAILLSTLGVSYSVGPNYINVSVDSRVNITNAPPELLTVTVVNGTGITLNAGSTKTVLCRATMLDYNGGSTIVNVTATYFDAVTNTTGDPDNNNSHYSNASCTQDSVNGFYANYTCAFPVLYYANPSLSWTCNVTAIDSYGFNDSLSNTSRIYEIYALNVTSPIDYGDLASGDTSANIPANVTNLGNVAIEVNVWGYGATPNDDLAFVCEQGTIDIDYERFAPNATAVYAQKTALSSSPQLLGFQVPKQTLAGTPSLNTSYWQLQVPVQPLLGLCNGTIVFQAEDANP